MSNETHLSPQPGWAFYLRTSKSEAHKSKLSQERQRRSIQQRLLTLRRLPVIREYVDAENDKNSERQAYHQMLDDARDGHFSFIGVESVKRLGRNDGETLRAIDELSKLGVAVRFADYPDIDPTSDDGRLAIGLSFTLAHRESRKIAERTLSGVYAKLQAGGWPGKAPDGYRNIEIRNDQPNEVRYTRLIEVDPEQWTIWRRAWDLLLQDQYTLDEICQKLHEAGYLFKSGRPFVEERRGKTTYAASGISRIFHNWFYAGWVVSKKFDIRPKTIRGQWEALVTTEEFEQGLTILKRRAQYRAPERKHFYLLQGLLHLQHAGKLIRLSCSRPNAHRKGGGTAYYNATSLSWYVMCDIIDEQIPHALRHIKISPDHLSLIRSLYEMEVQRLYRAPDQELSRLQQALETVDEEEARALRLFTSGKMTETIWNEAWNDWQSRRQELRDQLDMLSKAQGNLLSSLDDALLLLTQTSQIYVTLSAQKQRELLRLTIEKVIVNEDGELLPLRLLPPFAYLIKKSEQAEKVLAAGKLQVVAFEEGQTQSLERGSKVGSTALSLDILDDSDIEPSSIALLEKLSYWERSPAKDKLRQFLKFRSNNRL